MILKPDLMLIMQSTVLDNRERIKMYGEGL